MKIMSNTVQYKDAASPTNLSPVGSTESVETLYKDLLTIIKKLGWGVALPKMDEEDDVPGMIIGTSQYLQIISSLINRTQKKEDNKVNSYLI